MICNVYILMWVIVSLSATNTNEEILCKDLPQKRLEEILGAAFNARYMSIEEPLSENEITSYAREMSYGLDFSVSDKYIEDFVEQPAWKVTNHVQADMQEFENNRFRRALKFRRRAVYTHDWQCKSEVEWIDLGFDYFPRYLRSVNCLSDSCWFNIYKCQPRAFTVKILRRRPGKCLPVKDGNTTVSISGLPKDLRQMWVWEERAVNFCCDCSI